MAGTSTASARSWRFFPSTNWHCRPDKLDGNRCPESSPTTSSTAARLDQIPWNQRGLAAETGGKKSEQEAKDKGYTPRKLGTTSVHDLKDYAGDYSNPAMGLFPLHPDGDRFQVTLTTR